MKSGTSIVFTFFQLDQTLFKQYMRISNTNWTDATWLWDGLNEQQVRDIV